MLKSERDKHKFIKEIIGKRKEPEATDKTDETTTV
ncbi:hypothetical protein Ocin01_03636 [Orchesella cincta]|uniref:Uncharacterized protein n=1 Tax=Orchesella cincta TaxID=48709 RepID=A0A1D2NCV8_ORCCI|nr:hypothetical protein Ocin01_03636 [Orchesella cincta]